MPYLNSRGDALWGRDRAWLDNAGRVVEQQCDATACRIFAGPSPNGPWTQVAGRGCSAIAAGGGQWLAHLVGFGAFGPGGLLPLGPFGDGSVMALGADYNLARGLSAPDGTIAVILAYQQARGLRLVAADGTYIDYSDVYPKVTQVAALDRTRALFVDWRTNQIVTVGGLSVPAVLPGPVNWPTVLEVAGELWILYHAADKIVLHPFTDGVNGYILPAGFYPHARVLADGRVLVAWASGPDDTAGDSRVIDLASEPRVSLQTPAPVEPIVAIGRPFWDLWFVYGAVPANLPGNGYIQCGPVGAELPEKLVYALDGHVIAQYVAAELPGQTIEDEIAKAHVRRPGVPVIAYWSRKDQGGPVPSAEYVGVEGYRGATEPVPAYEARWRTAIGRCPRVIMITPVYTSNTNNTTDLRSIVPVVARIGRGCLNVVGTANFSGSGRKTGLQDHPEVRPAWVEFFAGIPSAPPPALPAPSPGPGPAPEPTPEPTPTPAPEPEEPPMPLTDEQKEQVFRDLGVIVKRAYPDRVRNAEEAAQGIRQAWDQLQDNATASDLIAFALAREGGATTDEVEAAARAAVLLRRR